MTKLTFVAAALVAAAAYTSDASAARSNGARHAQNATPANSAANCVRAPNVGAFASDPYVAPPCMPGSAN
jgi:hypothetical protein